METVVAGIEDTDEARDALHFARKFAAIEEAGLHVVSVHSDSIFYASVQEIEDARDRYFERMRELATSEAGPDFTFHRVVDTSVPAGLTRIAEDLGAGAMVIGSSHRGPIGRVLLGDEGARLTAGAPCAVIVTPRGWRRSETAAIRRIGVAFNASDEAEAALDYGSGVARTLDASLTLIAVVPDAVTVGRIGHTNHGYREILPEDMQEAIDIAAARAGGEEVERVILEGLPADELSAVSEDLDLLVLGSRGYGPLRRVLLGATSLKVMRSSACPVIVLPRSAGEAADPGT